jgi:hypothetical protein
VKTDRQSRVLADISNRPRYIRHAPVEWKKILAVPLPVVKLTKQADLRMDPGTRIQQGALRC